MGTVTEELIRDARTEGVTIGEKARCGRAGRTLHDRPCRVYCRPQTVETFGRIVRLYIVPELGHLKPVRG